MKTLKYQPLLFAAAIVLAMGGNARASIAYGSINNFDTVNDTGVPAHGFEIELDDIHSTDVTYTYNWNHYGTPKITEDTSIPGHTNVHIRYAALWTNTAWSAYTAVPSGPIAPTQGHQFTNPGTNFGGEHFGAGYRSQPSAVKYNWLIEGAGHSLVLGPAVSVSTPTFTYIPPVLPAPGVPAVPPQVQAAIVPPPKPIYYEFGDATWVKEIRTTSHTNSEIKLRHLVSPDADYPGVKDWRNGEPDEVEVEWQILQVDTMSAGGGANGQLVAAAQNLGNQGDDVVTRRYEFYTYAGPFDPDTHEALAQNVAADGIHGTLTYSNTAVVGKYLGAQMSAVEIASPLGLIDGLCDGQVGSAYPQRTVVISASTNFTATSSGSLPTGMLFDAARGVVYGTPSTNGVFLFTVSVSASNAPALNKTFPIIVAAAGAVLPPHSAVDISVSPTNGGTATGTGVYTNGTTTTVVATPSAGFQFANWAENGAVVSTSASYTFTNTVNQSLVANFISLPTLSLDATQPNALTLTWPTNFAGFVLQQNADLATTNWADAAAPASVVGANYRVTLLPGAGGGFFRLKKP